MRLSIQSLVVSSFALVAVSACTKPAAPAPELTSNSASNTPAPAVNAAPAPVANTAPAAAAPSADMNLVTETVYFEFDSSKLTSTAQDSLRKLAGLVKSNAGVKIQVEGHCDERGSNEYNLALGERRARSIQEFMISEGLTAADLSTISYGEERPAANGSSESVWAKNRRGEFKRM